MKQGQRRMTARILVVVLTLIIGMSLSACGGFKIEGTWKQTGDATWGQAQKGAIINFKSNGQANLFSPSDSYAFYKQGDSYRLDVTGLLGGSSSFDVEVVNKDKIELRQGGQLKVTLERTR